MRIHAFKLVKIHPRQMGVVHDHQILVVVFLSAGEKLCEPAIGVRLVLLMPN
jgi:hypothetical protein